MIKHSFPYTDEMAQFAKSHQDELFEFNQCFSCSILNGINDFFTPPLFTDSPMPGYHWHRDLLMDEKEKEKEKEIKTNGQLLLNFG